MSGWSITSRYKLASSNTAATAAGSVTASTESKVVAAANESRVSLYVTNDGDNPVYLAMGQTAKGSAGVRLNAGGGAVLIQDYTGDVSAVTSEGESTIAFAEI